METTTASKRKTMELLGRKLERLLGMSGATQEELSLKVGYSNNSMISQIISGEKMPSVQKLHAIADFFNIPANYLLDDVDYSAQDMELLIRVHEMIRNRETHPLYHASLRMHGINSK